MDEAFLSGGGEDAGGSGRPRRDHKPRFGRRSEAIAHGTTYEKAAALVDLVR